MSDFDTRPKGTVMYGAFNTFARAERALRVLKNAGYARASFEGGDAEERRSDEPPVLVVDAAAAGATRAAEILEEYGAQIRFAATHVTPEPEAVLAEVILPEAVLLDAVVPDSVVPDAVVAEATLPDAVVTEAVLTEADVSEVTLPEVLLPEVVLTHDKPRAVAQVERKPRVRRRARIEAQLTDVPATSVPPARQNVVIVTREIETIVTEGR